MGSRKGEIFGRPTQSKGRAQLPEVRVQAAGISCLAAVMAPAAKPLSGVGQEFRDLWGPA